MTDQTSTTRKKNGFKIRLKTIQIYLYLLYWYLLLCLVIQPATGYLSEHLNLFPNVETGWALVKAVLLGLALFFGAPRLQEQVRGLTGFMGSLLILWIILLQIVQAPEISRSFPLEARRVLGNTLLTGPGLWFVGVNILPIWQQIKKQRIWRVQSWALFVTYVGILIWGIVTQFRSYGILWGIYRNPKAGTSYIEIADGLAIIAFWIASLTNQRVVRDWVLALGGALLFFCLSRASFYAYLGVLALFVFFRSRWSVRIFLLFISVLAVIAVVVSDSAQVISGNGYRMITIVQSFDADESMQLRMHHLVQGLDRFSKHWLLGNFMAEVTLGEGAGTYIHSWLSFLEAYGLGPFLLSLMIFAFMVIQAIKIVNGTRGMLSGAALFYVCICFYCIISIVFARAYVWPYAGLAIGMASASLKKF